MGRPVLNFNYGVPLNAGCGRMGEKQGWETGQEEQAPLKLKGWETLREINAGFEIDVKAIARCSSWAISKGDSLKS